MASTDFTIADVLAWARTKPADERYNYSDNTNCALCQFLRETGRAVSPTVVPYFGADDPEGGWRDTEDGDLRQYGAALDDAVRGSSDGRRWTFGALVKRLEKLAPDTIVTPNQWTRLDAYLTDIETVSA